MSWCANFEFRVTQFAAELQTHFDVTLENPHVIGSDQIFAGVVKTVKTTRENLYLRTVVMPCHMPPSY